MKRIFSELNNKKGAALIFVMVALLIISIMISIAASISQANVKQASHQEKGIQAYYIARSGVELAYEVIMKKGLVTEFLEGHITSLPPENGIDFGEGTADVTVTYFEDANNMKKIKITSIGTLNDTDVSRTVSLEFFAKYLDYPTMTWSY